jgi:hypothetical protein
VSINNLSALRNRISWFCSCEAESFGAEPDETELESLLAMIYDQVNALLVALTVAAVSERAPNQVISLHLRVLRDLE